MLHVVLISFSVVYFTHFSWFSVNVSTFNHDFFSVFMFIFFQFYVCVMCYTSMMLCVSKNDCCTRLYTIMHILFRFPSYVFSVSHYFHITGYFNYFQRFVVATLLNVSFFLSRLDTLLIFCTLLVFHIFIICFLSKITYDIAF